jgi:hypothetical protein
VHEIRAHGFMRQCWQQVAMLAMALVETGHAPAAPVHEAVRLMRSAGALAWMGCHLAEWLAQRRRFADAARLLAWVGRRHAERGEAPSGHGERARARTLAALRASVEPAQADAWRIEGEAWSDDDVALALLAVGEQGGEVGEGEAGREGDEAGDGAGGHARGEGDEGDGGSLGNDGAGGNDGDEGEPGNGRAADRDAP